MNLLPDECPFLYINLPITISNEFVGSVDACEDEEGTGNVDEEDEICIDCDDDDSKLSENGSLGFDLNELAELEDGEANIDGEGYAEI